MVITESVEATFSTTITLDAQIISAAVGFDVTESFSVSDTQNVVINSPYTRADVIASPLYHLYDFEIWKEGILWDSQEGTGYAQKPIGVCFHIVYYE